MNKAKEIIETESKWQRIDSVVLIDNLIEELNKLQFDTYKQRVQLLAELTGSTKYTVEAWINSGRRNIKVPFLKLCRIASELDLDIDKLLEF